MLSSFKEKLNAPIANGKTPQRTSIAHPVRPMRLVSNMLLFFLAMTSTTPEGTPPKDFIPLNPQPAPTAAPPQDTSAILKALADMAKTNTAIPGNPAQASSDNVANGQNTFPQNLPLVNANSNLPPNQAVGAPGAPPFGGTSNDPSSSQNPASMFNAPPNMQAGTMLPAGMTPETFQQQVQILQFLTAQGVPQEQWGPILAAVTNGGSGGTGSTGMSNPFAAQQPNWQQAQNFGGASTMSRDRNGYNDQGMRSPSGRNRHPRSRSRSPRGWDGRRDVSPPRRRDSPVYGDYRGDAGGRNYISAPGRGRAQGDSYRRRSPDRFRRSPSPRQQGNGLPNPGPKWIEFDRSLGEGMIKGKQILQYRPNARPSNFSQC